jgi:flagellar basal-body rod protein FlgG
MDPLRGIVTAARTLSYYSRLQEVTTNNLANVNTAGFKADRLTAQRLADLEHPTPVQVTDLRQGTLRGTGRELDLALEGDGFFVVETRAGERLFRGGSLRLDGQGRIVDTDGDPVLGQNGTIALTGTKIEIRPDGTVLDDGHEAGRLRVVNLAADAALLKESNGRLRLERGALVDADETRVRQGHLEEANLNPIATMVSLVEIQRAYQANVTAVRTMDGVLSSITNDLGRVS